MSEPIKGSCHCGAVTIEVPSLPESLNDCNCSICRRYGTLWAYYTPQEVRIDYGQAEPDRYIWGDRMLYFNRCKGCGCVTHWSDVEGTRNRMGVNARMLPVELLHQVRIRQSDNAGNGLHIGGTIPKA